MSYEDTVTIELEALEYTYGSSVSTLSADPLSVAVAVEPFTGEYDAQIYVRADVVLSLTEDYPDRVPNIEIRNVKGLGDARKTDMLSRLRQEAADAVGNMVLGLLIEAARDALTAMNSPEGDCIFCMCSLMEGGSISGSREFIKLPCYHCFHLDCFARWWRWEQRSLHAKRKQIIEELKAAAGPKLHELGLTPDAQGLYTILCPSCRIKVDPSELAHALPRILPRKDSGADMSSSEQEASSHALDLPEADMACLRRMQQTHARLFALQKQKNGIVDESWSVSVGTQPSQSAAAPSNKASSTSEAANAQHDNESSRISKSSREGRRQQPGSSERGSQMNGDTRHDESRPGSRDRQRQRPKAGKPHRPKASQADQEFVKEMSALQLNEERTQRSGGKL